MDKVLIISPTPTHPQNAGNRSRIFSFAEELLARGKEVHFFYVAFEEVSSPEMHVFWGKNITVYYPIKTIGSPIERTIFERIAHKLRLVDHERYIYNRKLDDCFDDRILSICKNLHKRKNFSHVLVEYIFLSKALTAFGRDVKKIIDTHDKFTDRYAIFPEIDGKRKYGWYSTNRADEKKGLKRADAIIAIQDDENEYFRQLTDNHTITIGHLYKETYDLASYKAKEILLFASGNPINQDGYYYFVDTIWPTVKEQIPEAKLIVAGLICQSIIKTDGIVYKDDIECKADAYKNITIAINPMRYGSGLKIKTIEALTHGIPVVSTPHGALGFEAMIDKCIFIGNTPNEFRRELCNLLTNRNKYAETCLNIKKETYIYRNNNMNEIDKLLTTTNMNPYN